MRQDDDSIDEDPEGPSGDDLIDADEPAHFKCPHCKKLVYEDSEWCPHCGQWLSEREVSEKKKTWFIVAAILAALAMVYFMW